MGDGALEAAMGGFGLAVIIICFLSIVALFKKLSISVFGNRNKAISEGKLAFSNGLSINENPYHDDEKNLQKSWLKGWGLAQKHRKKLNL